jgi:hypothetical protein
MQISTLLFYFITLRLVTTIQALCFSGRPTQGRSKNVAPPMPIAQKNAAFRRHELATTTISKEIWGDSSLRNFL